MFSDLPEAFVTLGEHAQIGFIFYRRGADKIIDKTVYRFTTGRPDLRTGFCAGVVMIDPGFIFGGGENQPEPGLDFTTQHRFRFARVAEFAASPNCLFRLRNVGCHQAACRAQDILFARSARAFASWARDASEAVRGKTASRTI